MAELVAAPEADAAYASIADMMQAVVPATSMVGDHTLIPQLKAGTTGQFCRRYRVGEVNTAVDMVSHTNQNYPANLNTGLQYTFVTTVFPMQRTGHVNVKIGSNQWLQEHANCANLGDLAWSECMTHHGDRHFTVISIAMYIAPSLLATREGFKQHNEVLHSLIHQSRGQLGTDLSPNPETPVQFMNARVVTPYGAAFMSLVRSPLYNYMLRNHITPVFVFRGMLLQSPRAGHYIISTQDSGKHGHTLIAIVGGIHGQGAAERFRALDHFPRHMHITYTQDGQGNDLPRVTNDVHVHRNNAADEDDVEDVIVSSVNVVTPPRVVNNAARTPNVRRPARGRLFGPVSVTASSSVTASMRSNPYATGASASASTSWRPATFSGSNSSDRTMSLNYSTSYAPSTVQGSASSSSSTSSVGNTPTPTEVIDVDAIPADASVASAEVDPLDLVTDEALEAMMAEMERSGYQDYAHVERTM